LIAASNGRTAWMRRNSRQLGSGEAPDRESRLRAILLAATVIIVVGHGLTLTRLGAGAGVLLDLALSPLATITTAIAAIATMGSLLVLARRRELARNPPSPAEEPAPLAVMQGRTELNETLDRLLAEHQVAGRQLSLHLVDFDRFGDLNALLGEAEGDAFLRAVAERLLVLVEQTECLGRIGDDEFAIIQPETGGARHAEIYAKRIEDTLKDACAQVSRHARPAPSIGVAVAPEHGETAARLFHNASLALRSAKRKGGGGFRVFTRDLEMGVEARLQLERAISDGLLQGWFELRFQPQYDLQSRRLSGFEAVVRMKHPQRGELLPGEFLPVAEDSGLIQPLGEWLVREAVTAAAEWPTHLTLTVGISPAQLLQGDAAAMILATAAQSGFDPSRLVVAIPETAIVAPSESLADQLQRLKGRGAAILIDHFGGNGSNLRSLSLLPGDAVRLDDGLMRQIGENTAAEDLLRGLIGTARSFGLAIMAEGVEGVAQAHFLMANGCHLVQGFLFGRPCSAAEVAAIINKDFRKATSSAPINGVVRAYEAA
jgi:diguanylate cyclase (GGDEF)-like protein